MHLQITESGGTIFFDRSAREQQMCTPTH